MGAMAAVTSRCTAPQAKATTSTGRAGNQRLLKWRAEPGGNEYGARLIATQSSGLRLLATAGPAGMDGRAVIQELSFDRALPGRGAVHSRRVTVARARPHASGSRRAFESDRPWATGPSE